MTDSTVAPTPHATSADTPSVGAPFETTVASPEALAWAREVTQPGSWLPAEAEGILARLHVPGLPDLVEELDGIINTYATSDRPYDAYPSKLSNSPVRRLLDQQTQALRLRVFLCSLMISKRARSDINKGDGSIVWIYYLHSDTAAFLIRKPLPWVAATLSLVLHAAALDLIPYESMITACEKAGTDALAPCLEQLRATHRRRHAALVEDEYRWLRELPEEYVRTLQLLLRRGDPLAVDHLLIRGDVFTEHLRERDPGLFSHPGLAELFTHCLTRPGAQPKDTWWNGLRERLAAVPDAARTIGRVFELAIAAPKSEQGSHDELPYHYRPHVADILNGLVWVIAALPEEKTGPWADSLLERIVLFTGTGPGGSKVLRSERTATAAIRVLAGRGGDEAVASLGKVRTRIKKKTVLRTIDKTLGDIAAQSGITNEELLERTVPSYGLDPDGTRTDQLGEHGVTLSVAADGTASLGFLSAKGRPVASPPKALREAHPEEVKALRAELKELRQTLAAERVRLEGYLSEGRVWDTGPWVRHYLEHPVTGVLARRLLWEVSTDGGATWAAGLPEPDGDHWRLADADGRSTVARIGPADARVRLWHPVRHAPETVRRWREHLTDRETAQPVKQAYREIYLLTPAEETTRTYSNRFAAHILKYGQAKALLGTRGWYVPQLGGWNDGHYGSADRVYTDRFTGTAWRAELNLAMPSVNDLDGSGRAVTCATDQVRLYREEDQHQPAPLADVPTLALSEALRDVDLAVGVTSIAADPQWIDGGERPYLGYWRDTAFGELTESATVRREALERLVPRLRIADRLEITGRYLRVRGDLRTYRIHLGSANVLMEPDDSYLCVVVSGKRGPDVFLPFEEGGGRLSVILSKAFMFAKDTAITDPSITWQIRRGLE